MLSKPKAMIWDLDYTIVHWNNRARRCMASAFEDKGQGIPEKFGRELETVLIDQLNDRGRCVAVEALLERHKLDDLIPVYKEYLSKFRPADHDLFSGVREVLTAMKEGCIDTHLVTSRERRSAMALVSYFKLTDFKEMIFVKEPKYLAQLKEGETKKTPAFKAIAAKYRKDKREIWAIGDSPDDVKAAVEAGLRPFAFLPPAYPYISSFSALNEASGRLDVDEAQYIRNYTNFREKVLGPLLSLGGRVL